LLILFNNRGWVRGWHVNREVQRSVQRSLVSSIFCLCVYFDSQQKGANLYKGGATQKGATAVWEGQLPQTAPLDPPLCHNAVSATCRINLIRRRLVA